MPVRVCTGFEIGATTGWTTGNAGNRYLDTGVVGTPAIVTTTPRTGTYCLELSSSAATENIAWDTNTFPGSETRLAAVFAVYFPTSLPSATLRLARLDSLAVGAEIRFNSTGSVLEAQVGAGTIRTGPSVTTDTWYVIEVYFDVSTGTATLDWSVDGAAQTQASVAASASTVSFFTLGWNANATVTVRYDDVVIWTDTSAITFPVGPHKVEILTVDTGGTWVLTGTAANWSTFTANGTLDSSFTVTEARDRSDEWPPTIGASADGVVQDAIASGDFLSSPMTSYTLAAGEVVAGLRALVAGWAVSTTATNIRFDAYNGTTAETFFALADPNFDNSTTAPAWVCKMLTTANYDTQGELDALELRGGWGTDANPDCGWHGWAVELAIKEATGDATATPAVIACTTALPLPALSVGAAPAVVAASIALPNAPVGVGAAPAVLAATTALPQAAVGVGVAPAVIPSTVAVPLPTSVGQVGDATPTPAVIPAVAALPQAAVGVGAAPAVLAAVAALPQTAVSVGASPAVLSALAALPQPGVGVGASPAALSALTALPAAAVGVGVAPAVLASSVALPDAPVGVGAAPAVIPAVVAVPLPVSVGQTGDATVTPAVTAALATLPQTAVGVGVAPAVLAATVALPDAPVGVGAAPVVIAATVNIEIGFGVDVGVAPAVVPAMVALPDAPVGVGVSPAVAPLTVALPLPVSVGQDTSNVTVTPAVIPTTVALPDAPVGVGAAPAVLAAVAALAQPGVGVGVAPAVIPSTVALPLAAIAVHAFAQPATIAVLVALAQPAVGVGVAPAVIVLLVALPLPERVGPPAGININPAGPDVIGAISRQVVALPGSIS